jgi:hypothetical protein
VPHELLFTLTIQVSSSTEKTYAPQSDNDGYIDMDHDYDSDSGESIFAGMSGKKLGILIVIVGLGAFIAVQAMFGFPIKDLIRKEVTDEAKVITKDQQGTCLVEASDHRPRGISNCAYNVGDVLVVKYKQGTVPIEKYRLKA